MPQPLRAWLTIIGLALSLAACVGLPPVAPITPATQAVAFADKFRLNGRLSVRTAERLDTASIVWARQSATDETLQFFTPFGSQLAEIAVSRGRATLTRGKEIETTDSLAELVDRLLGVRIDTSDIARWVQGVGLDAAGNTSEQGWKIFAEDFQLRDGAKVASRITVTRQGGVDTTSVRIVIDEFHSK